VLLINKNNNINNNESYIIFSNLIKYSQNGIKRKLQDGDPGTGNGGGNPDGGGNNGGEKNDDVALKEHLQGNVWDLDFLKNKGARNLVRKIESKDIPTLCSGVGVFKTAVEQNETWRNIVEKAKTKNNQEQMVFGEQMNKPPRKQDGKLYLDKVWDLIK
ncbi:MAG: hypothetical protein II670_10635, partial [Alphaproteobacteria bacterium]|nr:hypothetical protein [Alphaproteobacteria bacterium]